MELIKISHLTKSYKASKKRVEVLKDVNLSLSKTGLVVILGKSGSGKSTLLNLIGGIDKPTKGNILYFFNKSKIADRNSSKPLKKVSFVFQHYHLLENETPLYNVMLPALIQGYDKHLAENQARELLNLFKLDEEVINKETRLLSGGEKERIAVLRALITDPEVILADEPTGALDVQNAIKTMDILKKASKKRLVILVTHNNKLANDYADRIITLADGRVVDDKKIHEVDEETYRTSVGKRKKNRWSSTIIKHNFKRRLKRNIVSTIGMMISLTFCYLLFGFTFQSEQAIDDVSKHHLDYGSCLIRKEVSSSTSSSISLVRTLRPEYDEIINIQKQFPEFDFLPNYDAVFNVGQFFVGNKVSAELNPSFVLNFNKSTIDFDLLISGNLENAYQWNDIVVNKKAFELIGDNELHYKVTYENKVEIEEETIVDYFEIEEKLNIVAVADEFDFLSVPKVYFNYLKIDELFENAYLENLSDYKKEDVYWKNLVMDSLPGDDISSYSMRCMLKDISKSERVEELKTFLDGEIKLENDSLTIKEALSSLTLAATYGLDIFLVIALSGSVLIVGVFSYSAYVDDKKESSILTCLGATNTEVVGIFASESLIVTLFGFLLSTAISFLLEKPANAILKALIDIPNLIDVPFSSMFGIKYFLPIMVLTCSILVTLLFSTVPILFNKNISIKKELADL